MSKISIKHFKLICYSESKNSDNGLALVHPPCHSGPKISKQDLNQRLIIKWQKLKGQAPSAVLIDCKINAYYGAFGKCPYLSR